MIIHMVFDFFAKKAKNRGKSNYDNGKYAQAMVDFTTAIRLKRDSSETYISRSYVYYKLGHYKLALKDLIRAPLCGTKLVEFGVDKLEEIIKQKIVHVCQTVTGMGGGCKLTPKLLPALIPKTKIEKLKEDFCSINEQYEWPKCSDGDSDLGVISPGYLWDTHLCELGYTLM